jgi:RNA polymerase sigma-70 factor (ECF subfamily)
MDPFASLYQQHYGEVYRFALFLTGDPARAEDLAADTFVRAWLARDRIRHPTVRAYLLAITRNLHRDRLRVKRPLPVQLDERRPDERPGVDARVEHRSELRHVGARLKCVAPGDRRALLLFVMREMSYEQIGHRLGISIGAVKSRIARARDALRIPADTGRQTGETRS